MSDPTRLATPSPRWKKCDARSSGGDQPLEQVPVTMLFRLGAVAQEGDGAARGELLQQPQRKLLAVVLIARFCRSNAGLVVISTR